MSDPQALPALPAPEPVKIAFNLRLDPETVKVLHELGGLRLERPGTVAKRLLSLHAPIELQSERARRAGAGA